MTGAQNLLSQSFPNKYIKQNKIHEVEKACSNEMQKVCIQNPTKFLQENI